MNFLPLIEAKRDGRQLTGRFQEIITAFVAGQIPDYQMAAFLMAVYFRGLNRDEVRELTLAMRDSGDRLFFPPDHRPLVDKHSTGGVGDKVSLPLAPLLAALGFRVPMISGRGLGITGGTLDKLESIPGFSTALAAPRIVELVQSLGVVMAGQTDRMVPADKGLYALRDVTGTVPSISLITASILSKKLAEGLQALVLDVKFGVAAFMPDLAQATELAHAMVALGRECGVNTRAVLTNMDRPLGRAAGNWLEVKESVDCLQGRGPADLRELVLTLAAHLQVQTDLAPNLAAGRDRAEKCLASEAPLRKWEEMLTAQGARMAEFHELLELDHLAPVVSEVRAPHGGHVTKCDARVIGEVVRDLGGGRLTKTSVVDPAVGLDLMAAPGETISSGDLLCRVHATDQASASMAVERLAGEAWVIANDPGAPLPPLCAGVIES